MLNGKWLIGLAGAVLLVVLAEAEGIDKEYEVDEHTLFLAHFNEGVTADYAKGSGEGTGAGITITDGKFGKGVLIDNGRGNKLRYKANKNFIPVQGTIEMWVKPNWDASTEGNKSGFFHLQNAGNDEQILYFNGKHRLCYTHEVPDQYCSISTKIYWMPGEWHHVAVTWDITRGEGQGKVALFIDGEEKASYDNASKITKAPAYLYIGSWASSRNQIDGVIDEVRISSRARSFSKAAEIRKEN